MRFSVQLQVRLQRSRTFNFQLLLNGMLSHISLYVHITFRDISLQYLSAQEELNYALHIVLFVGDTDYRMYLSSGCFFQWKIMLMFLFKSNVYRPSGTSAKRVVFNLTEGS